MDKTQIRNAATIILLRDRDSEPKVLMGQRGKTAAFMPNKFVFPGGALDEQDSQVSLARPINADCLRRLRAKADAGVAEALVLAAIRELWEETGLLLGQKGDAGQNGGVPEAWQSFYQSGVQPSGAGIRFVFRAITPPGRPRRFDARFFLADADCISGSLDDFTHASDELSHLQWIALSEARNFDLPFITEVVLAEIAAGLKSGESDQSVPFFFNEADTSYFDRLI